MRRLLFVNVFLLASVAVSFERPRTAAAIDPYAGNDPYWILLHEPAVVQELKLSTAQRPAYQALLDELDLRFFPLRNKSQQEATAGAAKIVADAIAKLKTLLTTPQRRRIQEILRRRAGPAALLHDDVAERMQTTDPQRRQIQELVDTTQSAVKALEKELAEGKPREPLEKRFVALKTDEQKKIEELLTPTQRAAWKDLWGAPFELAKLGQPAFKAPELIDAGGEWINSQPLKLQKLRGKVVVVHFYACGCINCIRNYPWYLEWHERFRQQAVVLIGVHTPETTAERDPEHVRRKAAEAKFQFPVLIDAKSETWNAWGNSMWPSVYLIDKRGRLRHFWPGELKWQGFDGEKHMRERIEQLLAEPDA